MRPRLLIGGAVFATALVVVAVLFVKGRSEEAETPLFRSQLISTGASFAPQAHLFGERVRARLDILYDAARIPPETVTASPRFAPYTIVSRTERRERLGGIGRIRYDFVLECVTRRCLPPESGIFKFSQTGVRYQPRGAQDVLIASVQWPPVRVASRTGAGDLEGLELQADVRDLPGLSYRVPPDIVTAVGYGLAVVLGLLGTALLAYALSVPGLVSALIARRRARLSPLRRALNLVQSSMTNGAETESRRALERLAVELRHTEEPDLAKAATRLAWRRSDPSTPTVEPLSGEVERVIAEEPR
jgi:hypothetical protein